MGPGFESLIVHQEKSTCKGQVFFLFKPQVWYIIMLCVYIIAEGVYHQPKVYISCAIGICIYVNSAYNKIIGYVFTI